MCSHSLKNVTDSCMSMAVISCLTICDTKLFVLNSTQSNLLNHVNTLYERPIYMYKSFINIRQCLSKRNNFPTSYGLWDSTLKCTIHRDR